MLTKFVESYDTINSIFGFLKYLFSSFIFSLILNAILSVTILSVKTKLLQSIDLWRMREGGISIKSVLRS